MVCFANIKQSSWIDAFYVCLISTLVCTWALNIPAAQLFTCLAILQNPDTEVFIFKALFMHKAKSHPQPPYLPPPPTNVTQYDIPSANHLPILSSSNIPCIQTF